MFDRLSLRARLILGVIALAAVGLAVADVVTYTSLSSFLVSRTDDSLDAAHVSAEAALRRPHGGPRDHGNGGPPPDHDAEPGDSPDISRLTASVPGLYVQVRRANGTVVATGAAPQFSGTKQSPPPRLPKTIALTSNNGVERVAYLTVPAKTGDGRYRVRASTSPATTASCCSSPPRSRASTARCTAWCSSSCSPRSPCSPGSRCSGSG